MARPIANYNNGTFIGLRMSVETQHHFKDADWWQSDDMQCGRIGLKKIHTSIIITTNVITLPVRGIMPEPIVVEPDMMKWEVVPTRRYPYLILRINHPAIGARRDEYHAMGAENRKDPGWDNPHIAINGSWGKRRKIPPLPDFPIIFDREYTQGALFPPACKCPNCNTHYE